MKIDEARVAKAQIGLAIMYGLGFLGVLSSLIFFPPNANEFIKSMLLTMLGYLGALVQQQSSYFFARQRPNEPAETTITSTPPVTTVTTKEHHETT